MMTSALISRKFLLIIWFGIALVWGVLLIYAFQLGLFSQMAAPTNRPVEGQVFLTTATPAATPASTATFPAFPDSGAAGETLPPANNPLPEPPSEGIAIALTPPAQAAGWTSTLDGKSHFDDDKIHAGFFKGHVFHGAVQFDLSTVPPGSTITYAAVELTGLNDKNLDWGGVWQMRLLNPEIDADWVNLTYDALRQAAIHSTLQPALPRTELAAGKINQFVLNNEQLRVLEQRLESGRVSFRIDGPSSGPDNLFSWTANSADPAALPTLKIVVNKLNYVIITSTPTPENILTVAARPTGEATPTPLPAHWVTPVIVTATPAPANAATATYQAQLVTAEAIVYGTATPLPANVWTATPEPLLIPLSDGVPPSISPTPVPAPIPDILAGKIAFLSNRAAPGAQNSQPLVYVIEPDSSAIFLLKDQSIYRTALVRDTLAANQQFLAFAQNVTLNNGSTQPAIFFYDYTLNIAEQITRFDTGTAYQPAWSPRQERIAFVSNSSGAEEIWAINRDGSDALQLTRDAATVVNKHPSWSPDGSQIVYWSNRTGRAQIWVTNADGSNHRLLHQSEFDDWNPVWIKYNDVIMRPLPQENSVPD